jgi:phosphatidylglycerophosphatase A
MMSDTSREPKASSASGKLRGMPPRIDADSRAAAKFAEITTMFTIIVMFRDNGTSQYILTIGKIARAFQFGAFEVTKSDREPKNSPNSADQANWAIWPATGLGVGFLRPASGTWGSLLGLPLAYGVGVLPMWWLQALVIVAFCVASVPIATLAGRCLGRGKDPGCIVIDEISGMLITFFLVPMSGVAVAVLGFLLFRVFDIVKLAPARQLEHLPEGLGVMADDWAAAVYANLALRLTIYLVPSLFD